MRTVLLLGLAAAVCSVQGIRIVLDENVSPIGRLDPATCPSGTRYCPDNRCLKDEFWCDGNVDCKDALDEKNCSKCSPNALKCDGECKPGVLRCDGTKDCKDGTDESDCGVIGETDVLRFRGNVQRRIEAVCDGHVHVYNSGADEKSCEQYHCKGGAHYCEKKYSGEPACVAKAHLCDGYEVCDDGSDETNCTFTVDKVHIPKGPEVQHITTTTTTASPLGVKRGQCAPGSRWCLSSGLGRCLRDEYWCDGQADCDGLIDEVNCTTCSSLGWSCGDGKCIRKEYHCDGSNDDCEEEEDEQNCPERDSKHYFICDDHDVSRHKSLRCDGQKDCLDGKDEYRCTKCVAGAIYCDHHCLQASKVCDGQDDCYDGLDESNCTAPGKLASPPKP